MREDTSVSVHTRKRRLATSSLSSHTEEERIVKISSLIYSERFSLQRDFLYREVKRGEEC